MFPNNDTSTVNSSDGDYLGDVKERLYHVVIPVFAAVTLLSGAVSSIVVMATPWVRRPMSPTIRLSLSLAAANAVTSFVMTIDLFVNSYLPIVYVDVASCVKLTIFTVKMAMIQVQILHLMAMAVNHYIGIRRPLHYATIVTPHFLRRVLALLWTTPFAAMFVGFSSVPGQGYQADSCQNNTFILEGNNFRIVWTCAFFGPTVLIMMSYCHIYVLLKNRAVYLASAEQRSQLRRNINTFTTTALIVGTFVVGWVPAVLKYVLICSDCLVSDLDHGTNMALGIFVNSLYTLKVFTDTFIYALRLPDVRRALVAMWEALKRHASAQEALTNDLSRTSSRTVSAQLSLSSTSLSRLRSTLGHGSPGSRSGSRSRSASPSLHSQNKRMASESPTSSRKNPLEIVVTSTKAGDEVRVQTLAEKPLDPILEDEIDYV